MCSIDEAMPFGIADLKAANVGAHSKLEFIELAVIYFIANIIVALFHKKYFQGLVHFFDYVLILLKESALERIHNVGH